MQTGNQKINPISMPEISDMVGKRFKEIMEVFTNRIPKELANNSGSESIKEHMESFTKELMEKMLAEFPVTLMSIIPTMFSQPTKFHWELVKHTLEASAKVKREYSSKLSSAGYDAEDDIKKTKEQLENLLAREFKTEVLLWRLMDEKKWKEALPIIKTIEKERENSELPLRVEVANWKGQIAFNLGDVDTFFESLATILENSAGQIAYSPNDVVYTITMLLQKELVALRIALTPLGHIRASNEGFTFMVKQGEEFQGYLIGKIIEAIFAEGKIRSGDDFRNWIKETRKSTVDMYKLLNPYVAEILY